MTNQEAISILKEWLHGCCGEECDPDREAFQMAINALELSDVIMKQLDCKHCEKN